MSVFSKDGLVGIAPGMRPFLVLLAAGLAVDGMAQSPKVVQETITLPVNTTNLDVEVSVAGNVSPEYREIDRIVVIHSSGSATGTVDIAIAELGATTALFNTGAMEGGVSVSSWPRYPWVANDVTNHIPYSAQVLNVNIAQTTNATPDVYKLTIYAK